MTEQTMPAGWYPDPQMASTQRYWNGERWTEQVAPLSQPASAPATVSEPTNPILIGLGYLLAFLFPIGGLVVAAVIYKRSDTHAWLIAALSVVAGLVWWQLAT